MSAYFGKRFSDYAKKSADLFVRIIELAIRDKQKEKELNQQLVEFVAPQLYPSYIFMNNTFKVLCCSYPAINLFGRNFSGFTHPELNALTEKLLLNQYYNRWHRKQEAYAKEMRRPGRVKTLSHIDYFLIPPPPPNRTDEPILKRVEIKLTAHEVFGLYCVLDLKDVKPKLEKSLREGNLDPDHADERCWDNPLVPF